MTTSRPILFSRPLVLAILAGRKTETRRLISGRSANERDLLDQANTAPTRGDGSCLAGALAALVRTASPVGQVGDELWVRESWRAGRRYDDTKPSDIPSGSAIHFEADGAVTLDGVGIDVERRREIMTLGMLRPSIFLPTWAPRLRLGVTSVKVERLNWLSHVDALAEGVEPDRPGDSAKPAFARLWDEINGKREGAAWADNPWVWVIGFTVTNCSTRSS